MKKLLTLLALLIGAGANAQTLGDVLTWKKGPGLGDAKLYTTPVNSSLYALNGSGTFTLLAQSNFANASHTHPASAITDFNSVGDARWSLLAHTHVSADITDGSTGGNGAADSGKVLKFKSTGGIQASTGASGIAVAGSSSGSGVGVDARSVDSWALYAGSTNGEAGWFVSAGTASTVKINANGASLALEASQMAGGNDDIATFSSGNGSATITTDGGMEWTGTGAQTTATNLPAFGTATKGVVPASGGGTTNFLRADGTWTAPGGSGTVTSVAVSGSDGIEVDSGSPVTTSGTIALGVNAATLKTHLSLGNVENTALSTWRGSTNVITVGALTQLKVNAVLRNLIIAPGSSYTTDRTLTLLTGDADRTLTLGGNTTLNGGTHSGTNTGDQTSIVGITGSLSDFNTALTGADFATGGGTATGTNTGDQTNISGNAATVTTNANLTGPITSVGNATTVAETELAAIAATTSAADKGIQYTGSGTATDYNLKFGTEAAYTGTPTFTAGAAPSGASTKTQFWERNGNRVTWQIMLTYATAGTTVTNLSLTFPTEFPTPAIPTGFTGADVRLWNCDITRLISTPSGTITNAGVFMISRNAANNGFVIASTGAFASGTYRTFILSGNYFTDTQ